MAAMVVFGYGVYHYLGSLKSRVTTEKAVAPAKAKFSLPGSVYVAQGGALYRLRAGSFQQIASGGWTQPSPGPTGQLLAVKREAQSSDLYLLDYDGHVVKQLTHNANTDVHLNHWSFYPRLSGDGQTIYYSWDPKDPGNFYRVDLAVYAMPVDGLQRQARAWTDPNQYTGGDVQPAPLKSGGLIYAKFGLTPDGKNISQLWLTTRAHATGTALTKEEDGCAQPALSSDGKRLAMVCTSAGQPSKLMLADFDGKALGPATVVASGLVGAPGWAPDGSGVLYLSGQDTTGHFQLFFQDLTPPAQIPAGPAAPASAKPTGPATPLPAPTPKPARQLTTSNDYDATSAPAWLAG
ncbi:MAG: PD40 domain-containing protein [Candidatus Dormibacteraeota bacterium]|uniref:PD40 domain-containing protein n=1 Tax=Candidatus Dormiibacter inghamiae TaxID=3127013 RepID=A0A934N859_9BACT|nr:PD40 domain-containing protein [Candidatus Dormibacteraeota bacterium]MBJ7605187.1 PD40 domain-containing protein [Candidatus Dormibacteraeota bacterium]